ncbi:MAG: hypothetical protein ACSHXF_13455 [Aquaticitalea sp.]
MVLLMIFSMSFAQQYQNNYCDLDCMDQAFELSDGIIEGGGGHQQAYDHFEAIYDNCTATYCDSEGGYK